MIKVIFDNKKQRFKISGLLIENKSNNIGFKSKSSAWKFIYYKIFEFFNNHKGLYEFLDEERKYYMNRTAFIKFLNNYFKNYTDYPFKPTDMIEYYEKYKDFENDSIKN